jgi:hypothetical protein
MSKMIHVEVEHEATKPMKLIKMIATKRFKKENPKVRFGRTSEPVEVRELADGKKITVFGFQPTV